MNEPKKVNLLAMKSKVAADNGSSVLSKEDTQKEAEVKKQNEAEQRALHILDKYEPREEEYKEVGIKRAEDDKKQKDAWKKKKEGYFRTSIFITLNDNDDYEALRREARGTLRFGYRHIFHYGIAQLKQLSPGEAVKQLEKIDEEFKKQGVVIKE